MIKLWIGLFCLTLMWIFDRSRNIEIEEYMIPIQANPIEVSNDNIYDAFDLGHKLAEVKPQEFSNAEEEPVLQKETENQGNFNTYFLQPGQP